LNFFQYFNTHYPCP